MSRGLGDVYKRQGESFCGLPLDEDSESDLTDSRLETWASQLKGEIPSLA